MQKSLNKVVLYASYQMGEKLPGYVQFALKALAETSFSVILLTNKRELSQETKDFLEENEIFLYLTENHGFDFGMWRRFLKDLAAGKKGFIQLNGIERLLLINDSIVYYKNRFIDFITQAEAMNADAIALTKSEEYNPHLQSFFLYLKTEALGAFYMHLLETPEQENYYDVVHKLEIGMGKVFEEADIKMEALFKTKPFPILSSIDLVCEGAGFIKRKLLEQRYTSKEKLFFLTHQGYDVLNEDYHQLIINSGLDENFKEEWLFKSKKKPFYTKADKLWEKGFEIAYNTIKKIKTNP